MVGLSCLINNTWSNLFTGGNSSQINKVIICTDDAGDFLSVCFGFAARKLEVQVLLFTEDDTEDDAADSFLCLVTFHLALTPRFGEDNNGPNFFFFFKVI